MRGKITPITGCTKATTDAVDFPVSAIDGTADGHRPIEPASLDIDRTLTAAVKSLDEAREALSSLCQALTGEARNVQAIAPILLTVPQACELLGYHKTKVYGLMKRGLLPYVTDMKTGHRRIEYRAIQLLAKRLRGRNFERKAS